MDIIIKYINEKTRLPIVVTAPTHKAVKVLRQYVSSHVDFATVHSVLGMREEIDGYGKISFKRNPNTGCKLYDYQFLILDEVSMLADELFEEIYNFVTHGLKVLFVGDSLQIPPVNKPDSVPFNHKIRSELGIGYFKMNEIIRQKWGNPIIDHSFHIREFIYRPIPVVNRQSQITQQGAINFYPRDEWNNIFQTYILPLYKSPEFKDDSNYVKILAWRNVTVNKYNDLIRSYIYDQKDLAKILPGDKLIANEAILEGKQIIIHNNEEMEVISYTIEFFPVGDGVMLEYYNTVVRIRRENDPYTDFNIKILHENSQKLYEELLEMQKKYALSQKQGSFNSKSAWMDYYAFKRQFADTKYNYAITCHKSQGSTYNIAVVLEGDIDKNINTYEKNRILYTACTRPKKDLFVIL
jgi:hypothetical protein